MRFFDIGKIEITFENCDSIVIDGKHIGACVLDNIQKTFRNFGCNAYGECEIVKHFALEVNNPPLRLTPRSGACR